MIPVMGFTFLTRFFPGDDTCFQEVQEEYVLFSCVTSIVPQVHVLLGVVAMFIGHLVGEYKFQWWTYGKCAL